MYWYKSEDSKTYQNSIQLNSIKKVVSYKPNKFLINFDNKNYKFATETEDLKSKWIDMLKTKSEVNRNSLNHPLIEFEINKKFITDYQQYPNITDERMKFKNKIDSIVKEEKKYRDVPKNKASFNNNKRESLTSANNNNNYKEEIIPLTKNNFNDEKKSLIKNEQQSFSGSYSNRSLNDKTNKFSQLERVDPPNRYSDETNTESGFFAWCSSLCFCAKTKKPQKDKNTYETDLDLL